MHAVRRNGILIGVCGAVVLAACSPDATSSPLLAPLPTQAILDGARGGDPGFFWLPPIVPVPGNSGPIDETATVAVEVVELQSGRVAARFATGGGPAGRVFVERSIPAYVARWQTTQCNTGPCRIPSNRVYRMSVVVTPAAGVGPAFVAGYADAFVVAHPREIPGVDRTRFVPVVNGDVLNVAFRIEHGMLGSVRVSPSSASLTVGQQLQLSAAANDIRGRPSAMPRLFWTHDVGVATVSPTGLVTAAGPAATWAVVMVGSRRDSMLVTVGAAAEVAPVPLTPASGVRVLQDNPLSGCSYDPVAGFGFVMPLSWTAGVGFIPLTGHELRVEHPATGTVLLNAVVNGTSTTFAACGQKVDAGRLDGWEFRVRAQYAGGSFGPWGTAAFGFLPGTPNGFGDVTLDPPNYGAGKTQVSIAGTVDPLTSATVSLQSRTRTWTTVVTAPIVQLYLGDATNQDAYYRAIGAPILVGVMDQGSIRFWLQNLLWDPTSSTTPGIQTVRAMSAALGGEVTVSPGQSVTIVP